MMKTGVCVYTGAIDAKEFAMLERYAMQGCAIAFMDKDKELGKRVKEEFERLYHVSVFFFHGDIQSEEDRDLFYSAVWAMYGRID